MGIGTNLKRILAEKKLSIKELSELTGISINTLYSITKRDNFKVHPKTLKQICNALDIQDEDLGYIEVIARKKNDTKEDYIVDEDSFVVHSEFEKFISNKKLTVSQFNEIRQIVTKFQEINLSLLHNKDE